jgi:two-component system sensor histidine kinase SenX3
MESSGLVLLSLALGLGVGAGFVTLLHMAARHGERAAAVVNPVVPDGIDQVLDALESGGVVLDPSNNVVKASPGAHAMGLVWNHQLAHPDLLALVGRVRRSGEAVAEDVVLPRGPFGDALVHLRVRLTRLGSRYVLLLADDRTEAFRLEEVRRDFVANISHELKTPIASVGLLAEALDSAADDPDQVRRFAKRMGGESRRLAHLAQDIIELSRLQAQDALQHPERVRIDDVVAQAADQAGVVASAGGIGVVVGKRSDAEVYGDERLLVMAVQNLIVNAVHYSSAGSRVGVGVRMRDNVVEIAITDQGVGIPEADLERVFERFFRVDEARSRHTGGTGLGLSIVKHIVQNHGGDIRVWSQTGRGSTFTIRLPASTGPESTESTSTEPSSIGRRASNTAGADPAAAASAVPKAGHLRNASPQPAARTGGEVT